MKKMQRSLVIAVVVMSMVMTLAGCVAGREPVAGESSVSDGASFESEIGDDGTASLDLFDDTSACENAEETMTEAEPDDVGTDSEDDTMAEASSEIPELWSKLLTCYRGDTDGFVTQYYMDGQRRENPVPVVVSVIFADREISEYAFRQSMFELAGIDDDQFISAAVSLGLGDIVEQEVLPESYTVHEVEITWMLDDERYSISSIADEMWDFSVVCYGEDAGNYLYGRYMVKCGNMDKVFRQIARNIEEGGDIIPLSDEEIISDENFAFKKVVEICLMKKAKYTEV